MLIGLYALPACDAAWTGSAASSGTWPVLRKPIGSEHGAIVAWVETGFGSRWRSEAGIALANRPVTTWIAVRQERLLGFACYDATARGFVGPIGVAGEARGAGIGAALLRACLHDMQTCGYGYAVAGSVSTPEFFRRVAGAVEIAGSTPGLYEGQLKVSPDQG